MLKAKAHTRRGPCWDHDRIPIEIKATHGEIIEALCVRHKPRSAREIIVAQTALEVIGCTCKRYTLSALWVTELSDVTRDVSARIIKDTAPLVTRPTISARDSVTDITTEADLRVTFKAITTCHAVTAIDTRSGGLMTERSLSTCHALTCGDASPCVTALTESTLYITALI
jgi:hypothetical protein